MKPDIIIFFIFYFFLRARVCDICDYKITLMKLWPYDINFPTGKSKINSQ